MLFCELEFELEELGSIPKLPGWAEVRLSACPAWVSVAELVLAWLFSGVLSVEVVFSKAETRWL